MKTKLLYALLVFSITFMGCSKDETSDITAPSTITATINGKSWVGTKINHVLFTQVPSVGLQRFDISAQDSSQILLLACESEFTANAGMPEKTYVFNEEDFGNNNALFINTYIMGANTFTEHMVETGKMTITAVNIEKKTISGTFSFTANKIGTLQDQIVTPDGINVTDGQFTNLTYTVSSY